jgi:hypothetical protein
VTAADKDDVPEIVGVRSWYEAIAGASDDVPEIVGARTSVLPAAGGRRTSMCLRDERGIG